VSTARPAALPENSVSWRIHREVALLLGWGSAILLQFAHPLVARGVADHSGFRGDARASWRRLHRTLGAMLALTFGGEEGAAQAARGINAIHDRVQGRLARAEGPYPAGTTYSAHDPELLRWVHATCLVMFMDAYERYVTPLHPAERDRYCAESAEVERLLGIPAGFLPRSVAELEAYRDRMLASGCIAVTDTARALAHDLLDPPVMRWLGPVAWLYRVTAIGPLPPAIRDAYGFRWARRDRAAFGLIAAVVRRGLPLLPSALRHWPAARAARRRGASAPSAAPCPHASAEPGCYNPRAFARLPHAEEDPR
jgi:uncharacterized protein (DUF2236 family)